MNKRTRNKMCHILMEVLWQMGRIFYISLLAAFAAIAVFAILSQFGLQVDGQRIWFSLAFMGVVTDYMYNWSEY